MRARPCRVVRLTLLAALLCWVAPALRAEVSVVHRDANNRVGTVILSFSTINEDADPIPQVDVRWHLYRTVSVDAALNVTGDEREDGPPEVAFRRSSSWPVVAWAYSNGRDADIAFAEWTGDGWSSVEFLTSHTDDERDPRLFVGSNDEIFIVWSVDGADPRVMMTSRSAGEAAWAIPVRVSPPGELVRRPTVTVFQGVVRVAYERQPNVGPTTSHELVVRRLEADALFAEELVINVPRTDRSDPVLHSQSGRLWLDWKHSSTQFGSAQYVNASWGAPEFYEWTDPSWVGVESVRLFIRRSLLASPDLADLGP
jgi:hypothetical protein